MQGNILKCRGAGRGMNKGSKSERCRRVLKERKRGLSQGRPLGGDVPSISVADEEAKTAPSPSTTDGGDDAAFLERLARREERRQKRLQEALERQKEFDPTVTDDGLSVPSGRQANDTGKDEAAGDEDKAETRRARYEIQETETVTKSYQRNEWRETQDGQREKDKEEEEQQQEEEEEKPKQRILEGNQITAEKTNKDQGPREDIKSSWDRKKGFPETKSQNGERVQEFTTHRLKHTESTFSRGKAGADTEEAESQVEAGRRLEELRRRRGETESEEFEKLKQKQQEAAVELEELKKKREERRKVLEEEEHRRKQEEAERKIREEEEKRRLKEEIERRRAEAAEKRQKMPEDGVSDDKKPFKCFTPKGSSLKIEERTEFLNKSAQKSKHLYTIIVIFISTLQGTKTTKSTKPAASDLPVPAEGVRNIKSMWEKGNVFASPTGTGSSNKVSAGGSWVFASTKWLTKTPEGNKSPAPKPSDLRPVDVSNKRNLWEKQSSEKTTSPMKVDLFHPRSSYWALLPLPICPVAPGMVDKELGGWEGGENEPLPMWSWVSQRRP
uniref:Caldesmon 1 n=1 Tax=Ornithorhynchus anatinus TaxID=9258 RepID=A0A6I8P6S6_ORNAN